jgi:hypothetical protein
MSSKKSSSSSSSKFMLLSCALWLMGKCLLLELGKGGEKTVDEEEARESREICECVLMCCFSETAHDFGVYFLFLSRLLHTSQQQHYARAAHDY